MNTEEQQKFASDKVKKATEAVYLGNTLNYKTDPHAEIALKIQEVNRTLWRMNDYWKAAEASKKWKILIFEAVLKSKLLYGLETTHLTKSCLKRIDAFQIRGLRKILGRKHTYWDREATNENILKEATVETFQKGSEANKKKNKDKTILPFSKAYKIRRQKLLGHVLRAENHDPMRQVTFNKNTGKPVTFTKKRSGKPREQWTEQAMKRVWKEFRHEAPKANASRPNKKRKYKASGRQAKYILQWAKDRKF